MALNSNSRLNDLVGILSANTSTMAASLTSASSIGMVRAGDARSLPIAIDQYPAVIVKLTRESESFEQIGQRNNKHELEFLIAGCVYQSESAEKSDEDSRILARNIKAILKSNITLSGTALVSLPESVDYFPVDLDGVYCSAALITFRATYLST